MDVSAILITADLPAIQVATCASPLLIPGHGLQAIRHGRLGPIQPARY